MAEWKNKAENVIIKTYMGENKKIEIRDEFITLSQFLKIADLVQSGGEAKSFLLSHEVLVNGEKEDRRGRKLRRGDIVKVNGRDYSIC